MGPIVGFEVPELDRLLFSILLTWAAPGVAASSAWLSALLDSARGVCGGVFCVRFTPLVSTCFSLVDDLRDEERGATAGADDMLWDAGLEMCTETMGFVTTFDRVLDAKVCLRSREGDTGVLAARDCDDCDRGESSKSDVFTSVSSAACTCIDEADDKGGVWTDGVCDVCR